MVFETKKALFFLKTGPFVLFGGSRNHQPTE